MAAIATTQYGALEGTTVDEVTSWKGVPFAAPPVGEQRFRPAQPPVGWTGTRQAQEFGPICPQHPNSLAQMIPGCRWHFYHREAVQAEDCLYLNVWAPADTSQAHPVMFWIHGGGFVAGSGSGLWFDGSQFARRENVIVVTVNYRFGAFGGVAREYQDGAGNNTLSDQIAALEWVRENISAFGGDPQRITIAGESAGAMSVCALMTAPRSAGLFSGAIVQSGHGSFTNTVDQALTARAVLLDALDIRDGSDESDALRRLPLQRIMAAQRKMSTESATTFRPVIDGVCLPQPIANAFAGAVESPVPLLIGTNTDENKRAVNMGWGRPKTSDPLVSRFAAALAPTGTDGVEALAERYRAEFDDDDEAWHAFATDRDWRARVRQLATAHANNGVPVYQYEFTLRSTAMGGALGACHALEIPFVFGNLDQPGARDFTGSDHAGEAGRFRTQEACRSAWGQFVRSAVPASALLPRWPRFSAAEPDVMMIGTHPEVRRGPHDERLDALARADPRTPPG